MAANQFHARYFIASARVMTGGSPTDEAFIADLNRHLSEVIAQNKLAGHFPDPYHGDLKVYELAGPDRVSHAGAPLPSGRTPGRGLAID